MDRPFPTEEEREIFDGLDQAIKDLGLVDVQEPHDWSDTVLGHAFDEDDEDDYEDDYEDDGPAGDYLADYWSNSAGPDEPQDWSDAR